MKILFTGGGTGGHFYPIIGVAEAINRIADQEKLVDVELFYMSDNPYDKNILFEHRIAFKKAEAGKIRAYFSILNIFDVIKTGFGILKAIWKIFLLYPDVIFGKGGYGSFPALCAAKLFGIPVIIHESDSIPGRVNKWAGRFAVRVGISFPDAAKYFDEKKVALVGVPIQRELLNPVGSGAHEFLKIDPGVPVIFILGGSQGSVAINDVVLDILPELVLKYYVIHQTGRANYRDVIGRSGVVLQSSAHQDRYKPFDFLNDAALRMVASVTDLAVSRAGATSIFLLALWGVPTILIPLVDSHDDHQKKNAFAYSRSGGAIVVEEDNLKPHVLLSEIDRLMTDSKLRTNMKEKAKSFSRPDAADILGREIINIALTHEK